MSKNEGSVVLQKAQNWEELKGKGVSRLGKLGGKNKKGRPKRKGGVTVSKNRYKGGIEGKVKTAKKND